MKKLLLIILGLAVIAGSVYFAATYKPKPDETKTVGQPQPVLQPSTPPDNDFTVPELEDFDREINDLDQSINQL